jgi:hypothetical protein
MGRTCFKSRWDTREAHRLERIFIGVLIVITPLRPYLVIPSPLPFRSPRSAVVRALQYGLQQPAIAVAEV